MGDTATSVNQGGASGSTGIQLGGKQMRMAAAEARRVLVEMAADKLGLPADELTVIDGVVHAPRTTQQEGVLCRADRRALFQRPARLEQADRATRSMRPARRSRKPRTITRSSASRSRARTSRPKVYCAGGLLHRRQSARHGAWPHDPPAGRGRGAGEGRRKLDQGYPWRQGRLGQGLPRRRRRQGMGRGQGGREAQGRLVGREAAVPRSGRALRSHPQGAGAQARDRRQGRPATSTRRSRPPRA